MAASEPSPVSDESSSEGSQLRLANEAVPQSREQPMAAMSPRLAILAETSLREHSAAEPSTTTIEPSRVRKRNSTSERRRMRERDLANASPSQRELVRLLIDQEQEASILRKQLYIANQRVDSEARRAAELERANQLATQRYREINESRVVVQQEASKAIQDSRLYHLELENAQREIERAQESLKHIERERDEAEAAAARARAKTRKLREQQIVAAARKEGRRLGFEAGFEHARQERLLIAARPRSESSRRNPRSSSRDVASEPYSPADSASRRKPRRDVDTTPNSPADSVSRRNLRPSSEAVTRLHFSPDQASRRHSIRNHNRQEENEVALRRSPVLDDLETSPPMSVSDLPIRNLPPIIPSVVSPAVSANLSRTPLRPFQPPPESTHESRSHTPTPPTSPAQTIQDQDLANISPSIQRFPIDIPPQEELSREELEREYNTKENPNDIIKQMPQEGWVTASKHREIKGSPPAPYPGSQPPPLLPAPQPQSKNVRPLKFAPKIVRFPSLAKTKQQAASWYRSLSFRKKNRPVIDPINEADTSVQNPPTSATNDKGKAPERNSASSQSDIDAHYVPPRPSQSWYKKSAPSSLHTTDARRRPISGVESSPGLSQFELLFTPHVGANSVKSGKEGKRLKEKDSQLSMIKEETPTTDRFLTASSSRMRSSSIPHPNFIGMEHKGSHEALGSSSSPMKRRHPLAIVVPNPDDPLPPPGVSYSQAGPSNLQQRDYPIPHKGSQSSARTNNTSIRIEVEPPSALAPDPVRSPLHTGRNHLSPYQVFRPTSQSSSSRINPMPSIKSLQSSGDNQLEPPPPLPIESRSGSRASRRKDSGGLGSVMPRSAASRPQSAMSATPNGNPVVNKSAEDARSSRSRTPRAPTPMGMTPRATPTHPRPESARSSTSKNQLSVLNLDTNQSNIGQQQTPRQQPSPLALSLGVPGHSASRVSLREVGSFANGFDDSSYLDPALYPPLDGDGHHQRAGLKQNPPQPSSSALNLVSPVRHSTSRKSLREAGSFANGFDDGTYLDPAFYPSMRESNLNVPSRPVSRGTSSTLSYA